MRGKSTIAASLAQLIAHAGKRVIIVDCDLRNPSLSANLAPNATAGIIDVLSGARSLEEAIWRDPRTNLAFLPSAKKNPAFSYQRNPVFGANRETVRQITGILRLRYSRSSAARTYRRCPRDNAADRLLHSGRRMGANENRRSPARASYRSKRVRGLDRYGAQQDRHAGNETLRQLSQRLLQQRTLYPLRPGSGRMMSPDDRSFHHVDLADRALARACDDRRHPFQRDGFQQLSRLQW